MAYRAFTLAPNKTEVQPLVNKNAFPEQLNPVSSDQQNRSSNPPPQVMRVAPQNVSGSAASSANTNVTSSSTPGPNQNQVKKRQAKPNGEAGKSSAAATKPKKTQPVLDERQANLKRILQESAEKAAAQQQKQGVRQQQQQSPSSSNSSTKGINGSNQAAAPGNPSASPNVNQNVANANIPKRKLF
jgi:hypothetical protein